MWRSCFFLSVTHKWSYFGSPCWSQSGLLSKLCRVDWRVVFFFTSFKHYSFQTLSALSQRAIWCISQPEENRCALIMHHHFLTICWLNTVNRCASSAWIILCLLILSVCFSLFSLPQYNVWCLVTVLPLCSVDHLRSGCSPHTDCHSHGSEAAAAYHSQVSMRMFEVCMINQASNVESFVCSVMFCLCRAGKRWKNNMTFTFCLKSLCDEFLRHCCILEIPLTPELFVYGKRRHWQCKLVRSMCFQLFKD